MLCVAAAWSVTSNLNTHTHTHTNKIHKTHSSTQRTHTHIVLFATFPLQMLCVAAAWSVTASLDKLGVMYGSLWMYFAGQRILIGAL